MSWFDYLGGNKLSVIDTDTNKQLTDDKLEGNLVDEKINSDTSRLYLLTDKALEVWDAMAGKRTESIPGLEHEVVIARGNGIAPRSSNEYISGALQAPGLAELPKTEGIRMKQRFCGQWVLALVIACACGTPLAAHAQYFPGPVAVPEEAMYWWANVDGAGHRLSGQHDYIMHFPPGGLPPNDAFWSLTMGDAKNRYVPNPINRYSVGDRSGLVSNADGSVDIYIQKTAARGHESNWLPAPSGSFLLWLRVYQPGEAILDGTYKAPPVVQAK